MSLLPATRSPRWLLVFVLTAVGLTAAVLAIGAANRGEPPPGAAITTAGGVLSGVAAALAALGYFGARATFAGALIGLVLGLAQMAYVAQTPADGMADLGAVVSFMLLGAIGLAVGAVIDLVRWLRRRR